MWYKKVGYFFKNLKILLSKTSAKNNLKYLVKIINKPQCDVFKAHHFHSFFYFPFFFSNNKYKKEPLKTVIHVYN